jgi:hypothetical protein
VSSKEDNLNNGDLKQSWMEPEKHTCKYLHQPFVNTVTTGFFRCKTERTARVDAKRKLVGMPGCLCLPGFLRQGVLFHDMKMSESVLATFMCLRESAIKAKSKLIF